jgi:hypothetical protein
MRKDIVLVGMKTNEETDKAVSSLDGAVQDMVTALDSGMVRPSASGLVNTTSGIVRDVSGLVRDASGLVRDLVGMVKDDAAAEHYKAIVQMIQDLCGETECFSRYCQTFTDLTIREDPDDMIEDTLCLVNDVCGMVRNASHLSERVLILPDGNSRDVVGSLTQRSECIRKKVADLEKQSEFVTDTEETSSLVINASGLVRDVSGIIRDISGLIRGNGWR